MTEPHGIPGNPIPAMIRAGLSANEGLRQFMAAGGEARRQIWLDVWRSTLQAVTAGLTIQEQPLWRRPLDSEIARGSFRTRDRYWYQAVVTLRDTTSGELFRSDFAVTSNRLLTYGSALSQAMRLADLGVSEYGEEVVSGEITGVYDREGGPLGEEGVL